MPKGCASGVWGDVHFFFFLFCQCHSEAISICEEFASPFRSYRGIKGGTLKRGRFLRLQFALGCGGRCTNEIWCACVCKIKSKQRNKTKALICNSLIFSPFIAWFAWCMKIIELYNQWLTVIVNHRWPKYKHMYAQTSARQNVHLAKTVHSRQ